MTMSITVERICTDSELDSLRTDWNWLAADVPFRRFEWLATWWRHYRQPGSDLFVLTARDSNRELIGILPLYLHRSLRHGRVLRFLGSGEICSDYLTLLSVKGAEHEVASEISSHLTQKVRRNWDLLELVGQEQNDLTIGLLTERFRSSGYGVHIRSGLSCWRLELPGTWEEYLMSLSKTRRDRVRRLVRQAFDSGRATNGLVQQPADFQRYFDRLVDLHQKRRTSLGEAGCFASRRFIAFHHDVMQQLHSLGLLRLWWTDFDGQPAAIEYALVGGDTIYFYQSGIEPALAKQQPGWLSTIGSLRYVQSQGYRFYDFLRGDEAYKSSWGATKRPTTELRIVAPRLSARIRHAAWRTRKLAGRIKRSTLPKPSTRMLTSRFAGSN